MPFGSVAQEQWMMINQPAIYKRWVKKYGHHPDFKSAMRKKTTKKKTRKRGSK